MEIKRDEVCIFIPTLNEAPTIGGLIEEFRSMGFSHIFIMDGQSSDDTVKIAREKGAQVEIQKGKGKGNAILQSINQIEQPYILMLDGDGTYLPEDADKMLTPLFEGYDHVIGNRMASHEEGALSRLNLFGNQLINFLFKIAHGMYLYDILSGYRAFTRESIREMNLKEGGFEIETEMAAEAVRHSQKILVVETFYKKRPGTDTKLHPLKDGARIISTVYKLAKRSNPLFYFGIIGFIVTLLGCFSGVYVILEWMNNTERIPLTIFTVLLIMGGIQIFLFGLLGDMMLSFHKEMIQEIQRLRPPNPPE